MLTNNTGGKRCFSVSRKNNISYIHVFSSEYL